MTKEQGFRLMNKPITVASWLCFLLVGGGVSAQAARADTKPPSGKTHVNTIGMKLVRIEPGTFVMGQGEAPPRSRKEWETRDWDESPAHRVRITHAFYLGAFEVTNAQYERFDPEHKRFRGRSRVSKGDGEPVTFVTWEQAVGFCDWLSKKEGLPYRLPTEAEWEYACRSGTTTVYNTGDSLTTGQANIGKSPEGKPIFTLPVGHYPPSAWGLYDMHGNVAEWCLDWYGPYSAGEQVDPVGRADGYARVVRGGSFLVPSWAKDARRLARAANRSGHLPEDANRATGFRVVLGKLPETKPLPPVVSPYQKDVRQGPAPRKGPDPRKPYFVDFGRTRKGPTIPRDTWGPIFSQWNHFAAVCVCPNGDVLACWYTTVSESGRELAQATSRLRASSDRWDPASLFFDVPDVNDHAPVLFSDGKRVYHFCTQSLAGWDSASDIVRTSDDSGATWSKPRIILPRDDPKALSQPCSAFLHQSGALVLACDGNGHRDERLMTSADGGKTWKVRKGDLRATVGRYAIHPAIVPLADGSILAFLRGPNPMPVARSKDLGDTWEVKATPFPGISVGQKAAALRLASGAILLCAADSRKELVGGGTYAALSLDEGKTWAHVRKVDGVGGYMAAAQAPDGVIYLVGSRLSCAAFNEAWLREGKPLKSRTK
jgi:formylglycine-generating enzyme required for sulfatase activity